LLQNRLHEAMSLFSKMCNSRWFRMSQIILFLNKIDIFAEKIKTVPLSVCFREYHGEHLCLYRSTLTLIIDQDR